MIDLFDVNSGTWGYQATAASVAGATVMERVQGITVGELMKEHGIERIDLLKIDIEGAEAEVMKTSAEWIDSVDVIVAELHDRFKRGCSLSFYSATSAFEEEWLARENVVVARSGTVIRS